MQANSLAKKISLTSKLERMEKYDMTLELEIERIMAMDIPANEKSRLLSDLYCTTYTITKSGLIKVLCKPEMMSRVARLMHMQLVSTSSASKWGIVYFACKISGYFVDMSYETFARIIQVTFGASLVDNKDKLISPKTISNGIAIVEIVLSRPEDQLKDKEKDILVAVRTLAKNIAETCQS